MKKILIVMLCCFFITKLAAQEKQYYHQLGASVSMFSGIGLSYKYFFTDIIAAKVTGMFIPMNTIMEIVIIIVITVLNFKCILINPRLYHSFFYLVLTNGIVKTKTIILTKHLKRLLLVPASVWI